MLVDIRCTVITYCPYEQIQLTLRLLSFDNEIMKK